MYDTEVVLAALNALCADGEAPLLSETLHDGLFAGVRRLLGSFTPLAPSGPWEPASITDRTHLGSSGPRQLASITDLTHLAIFGPRSRTQPPSPSVDVTRLVNLPEDIKKDERTGEITLHLKDAVWSEEHLDPKYNYSFAEGEDTKTYWRGGEEYKRPSGWQRFALKVLDKFEDNTWLGPTGRGTESTPGEWPVSYHGTREQSVKAIAEEGYKMGHRHLYGLGVYSTPDIKIAEKFAKVFPCKGDKYKVIMQNRINPKYREQCKDKAGKEVKGYWLIPTKDKSEEEAREIVEMALRPYGVLLKKV